MTFGFKATVPHTTAVAVRGCCVPRRFFGSNAIVVTPQEAVTETADGTLVHYPCEDAFYLIPTIELVDADEAVFPPMGVFQNYLSDPSLLRKDTKDFLSGMTTRAWSCYFGVSPLSSAEESAADMDGEDCSRNMWRGGALLFFVLLVLGSLATLTSCLSKGSPNRKKRIVVVM